MKRIPRALGALLISGLFALSACGSSDPLDSGGSGSDSSNTDDPIAIGSLDYYSSEIIAEIYAQVLEGEGFAVDRQFRIGPREVYLPELRAGNIDLFPEYTGPLLQYLEPNPEARGADEIYAALKDAVPEGFRILDQSPATDQDSYVVTQAFADQWGLTTIADLAKVEGPRILGASSEAESRPNGPKGLKEFYGIDAGFTPIEDSGGPLTVKALNDGDIQFAIIYTADPSIKKNNLISLEDPEGLFLASHVVPLAGENVSDEAAALINEVSAAMTPDELVSLNARSVEEQLSASQIAKDWLADKNFAG
ncbi:MAG: ABC transporter substrate-binding protein [Ancrocorticia sp.]